MDVPAIFWTAFIVGFSGAMMPGPLLTVTIAESMRRGAGAGPLLVLGHGLLEVALVVALLLGLAALLARPVVTAVIGMIGGAFLVFLAYNMGRDALLHRLQLPAGDGAVATSPAGVVSAKSSWAAGSPFRLVVSGATVSISNPYWSLWWATVGLGYITFSWQKGWIGVSSFVGGHVLADLIWYSLVAATVAGGRRLLTPGIYRGIIMVCAIFLAGLGGYFFYQGIKHFLA